MEIVVVTVLGGILALDGTSVGQFMLSRPLVTGALVGAALGDASVGLTVGAVLELYLIVSFPTGGARFPEGATATTVAVASAAGLAGEGGALPLAIAVGLLWGHLGGLSITLLRHVNSRFVPEPGTKPPDQGEGVSSRHVNAAHGLGIALDFVRGALVTLSGVVVGRTIVAVLGGSWPLSPSSSTGLLLVGGSISAGILLRDFGGFRSRRTLLVAGMALGIVGARFL